MSLRLRRTIPLVMIAGVLSCSGSSLVLVSVQAPPSVVYAGVTLIMTADAQQTSRFDKIDFVDGVYKAGVYLPSDVSGVVTLTAAVDRDGCVVATGSATTPAVAAGETIGPVLLPLTAASGPCISADGGVGSGGVGASGGAGGSIGSGGVAGGGLAGGSGVAGGGGGPGAAGVSGSGGVIAGAGGRGGVAGGGANGDGGSSVGSGGTKGSGGTSNGGTNGSGGMMRGTGGRMMGSGGSSGSGGSMVGTGGTNGSGGSMVGTGGSSGSGGSGACTCSGVNQTCLPGSTTCVCSQSDSAACANVPCGSVTNICQQVVQCPNTCGLGYLCDQSMNACRPLIGTGCGGSIIAGTGESTGTATPSCPIEN